MKKILSFVCLQFFVINILAQDQTIEGNLTTSGDIRLGKNVASKWGEDARLYLQGTDLSNDALWLAKYTPYHEKTDLRINIGDNIDLGDRLVVGVTQWDTKVFHEWFVVRSNGNVGIGIAAPTYKLEVAGTIRSKEVKIEATDWPDFVFDKNYNLPSLSEVEKHIKEKQHLPNIPSEKEVKENGIDLGMMQAKLLQKIEELTLYVIEQDKKIMELQGKLDDLKKE